MIILCQHCATIKVMLDSWRGTHFVTSAWWWSKAHPLNLMHISTDLESIEELLIPWLSLLTSAISQLLKTWAGWSLVEYCVSMQLEHLKNNIACQSTELAHQTWSVLKFGHFLGLFDQILGSFGLLNAIPLWPRSCFRALIAWTIIYKLYSGVKRSTTFLPMQHNADLMFLVWWHKTDLVSSAWTVTCLNVFFFLLFCVFSHRGIFFVHIGTILFCFWIVNITTLLFVAFMCNNTCFYLIYFTF